jgi:DNA-binding response OmpR family regulator
VDEETRGAELGAAAYLVKPVGRDDLLATLTEVGAFGSGAQPSPRMTREEAQ